MYYLVKRLTLRLIKSHKNERSYYLRSITAESYFLYMLSHQINFKLKFLENFWWILSFYWKMCTFCIEPDVGLVFVQYEIIIFAKNGNIRLHLVVVRTCKEQVLRQTIKIHQKIWKFQRKIYLMRQYIQKI